MSGVTVTARRLDGGGELTLTGFTELRLTGSLSSPAESFTCTAPVDRFPQPLGEIAVTRDGNLLFSGRVDRQSARLEEGGRLLTLEARDKGALLLDNEATPCVLANLRLSTLFHRCAAPYGFTLYNPNPGGSLALYTVHKNQSQWDALCGFIRRVNGRTPYVRGDVVMVDRPGSAQILTIGGQGGPFTSLRHTVTPYHVVSQVVLRDADGNYSSSVHNRTADRWNIRRVRYVIPSNEFMDAPGLDANQRIRRSMLEMEQVVVQLPGLVGTYPGRSARIADSELELANLLVETRTWELGPTGLMTTLKLVNGTYYD